MAEPKTRIDVTDLFDEEEKKDEKQVKAEGEPEGQKPKPNKAKAKVKKLLPELSTNKDVSRAIMLFTASDLLTTNAQIFSAKRPSKEDVIALAKYFIKEIEGYNGE